MAETLKDYLVKLGFAVEKGEEARFNATLAGLASTTAKIAAGLTAAAGTIAGTVLKIASSFDDLYFASQRTNASVASIKSLSYALSQVGGSSDQARAAIEGIAAAIRTNPGAEAMLNAQGVATRVNGQLRETGALFADIRNKFSNQPYYVSRQFAEMVGIDERTWKATVDLWPEIERHQKEYLARAKEFGLDPDKAADSSNKLMTSFRSLMGTVDVLSQKIVTDLQPILTKWLEAISAWFKDHRDDIVAALKGIMKAVEGLADDFGRLVSAMKPVADGFMDIAKLIAGDEAGSLKTALEGLAVFMAGAWALRVIGVVGRLNFALGAAMAAIYGLSQLDWRGSLHGQGPGPFPVPDEMDPAIDPKRDGWAGWWGRWGWGGSKWGGGPGDARAGKHMGSTSARGAGAAPGPGMAKITSKSGQTAWVSAESAPQFQGFINDLEASGYKIKDLQGFSNRTIAGSGKISQHAYGQAIDINPGPNDLGTGTGDLPANTDELAAKWGLGWGARWKNKNDPMHFSTGKGENGKIMSKDETDRLLRLQRIEKLERIRDKTSYLSSPPILGGSTSRTASLNQKTDITIIGSSDPAGSAAALGGAQRRIGAELLRDATSAFA